MFVLAYEISKSTLSIDDHYFWQYVDSFDSCYSSSWLCKFEHKEILISFGMGNDFDFSVSHYCNCS